MTKTAVVSVNQKTYASQLSGSAIWLLLQTERAFRVQPGKGNNFIIGQGKEGIYSSG